MWMSAVDEVELSSNLNDAFWVSQMRPDGGVIYYDLKKDV